MRCKKHPADLSSAVGVCASCLRERLFAVMAAQAQKEAQLHQSQLDRRKSDSQPPAPLSFPRSVSPYVSGLKSTNPGPAQRLFRSTPLVGPNGAVTVEDKQKTKKSNGGRFARMFLRLFRSKPEKPNLNSVSGTDPRVLGEYSCTASPSWFSGIIPGLRRKQIRTFSLDEGAIAARQKACRNRDRGMSPVRHSDDHDEHCEGGSSGYSSESSQGWKQTARMTPATVRRRGASHSRTASGLAFCLSPLVRASPNRHWNQIGLPPETPIVVGESRVSPKPHLPAATSFCKNRSRKLADFGRHGYYPNR